ncbi:hypothetical protein B7P33_12825 [Sediminicola luteus]|uniref:histidine kinase n=1 Tax=Sediminicola luteus TaxID=319238 RepID=A0A2A4G803_9FLAO|nr:hypothetical protein B7P33_12825 [Sediminicola luteus]
MLSLGFGNQLLAQDLSKIDSLRQQLAHMEKHTGFSANDTTYLLTLNRLAGSLRYFDHEEFRLVIDKSIQLNEKHNYTKGLMYAFTHLADYYADEGDPRAMGNYMRAAELCQNERDTEHLIDIQNLMATEYSNKGQYDKAMDYYLKNQELCINSDDIGRQSINQGNMALVYCDLKDYKRGIDLLTKAIALSSGNKDPYGEAVYLANRAWAYAEIDTFKKALLDINLALEYFEQRKLMDWVAYAYAVKGQIYVGMEKHSWALHWLKQSEAQYAKINDKRAELGAYNTMAQAYLGLGELDMANTYGDRSYQMALNLDYASGILQASKTMAKIKRETGDFESALDYHLLMTKISDSLSNFENRNMLLVEKTKMNRDREKEEALLEKEHALARQKYINYAILALGLVLLVILWMYRKGVSDQGKLIKKLNKKTRELKRNEEELMTINSTKDKLFSIIGHDLRSPIAALQDLLKLFKEGDIPEKDLLDYIPKLHKDVDHIWFTLNNLLSWSRSQMNGATTSPKEIDLGELASENINFLSEIAENKEIGFVNQLPKDTMAWADADHINVVFRNLFSNALKFTKAGGTITAGIESFENYWKISVADTGVGMDEATQEKIFQKEHTYTTYGTNNEKGTGLGLSLCKDMIQKNKGSIWVESEIGVGSTFYFMVPKSRMQLQKAI